MAHLKSDKQVLISACDGEAQSLQLEVCLKRNSRIKARKGAKTQNKIFIISSGKGYS